MASPRQADYDSGVTTTALPLFPQY